MEFQAKEKHFKKVIIKNKTGNVWEWFHKGTRMVIKANKQQHVLLSDVLLTPTVVTHCSRTQVTLYVFFGSYYKNNRFFLGYTVQAQLCVTQTHTSPCVWQSVYMRGFTPVVLHRHWHKPDTLFGLWSRFHTIWYFHTLLVPHQLITL